MEIAKVGKVCLTVVTGVYTVCMGLFTGCELKKYSARKRDRAAVHGYEKRKRDERIEQLEKEVAELRAENDKLFAEALNRTEGTA